MTDPVAGGPAQPGKIASAASAPAGMPTGGLAAQGRALEEKQAFAEAAQLYALWTGMAPRDPAAWAALGRAEMRCLRGRAAAAALSEAARLAPRAYAIHRDLAAVLTAIGRAAEGQAMLRAHFAQFPLLALPSQAPVDAPAILIFRGFSGTRAVLVRSRMHGTRAMLRGGHMSLEGLLDQDRMRSIEYTVAGNNLNSSPPPAASVWFNSIADPDLERETLQSLTDHLEATGRACVNPPARVLATTRDGNARRLARIPDMVVPRTLRVPVAGRPTAEIAAEIAEHGLTPPLVLQRAGTILADAPVLARKRDDIDAFIVANAGDEFIYAATYIDNPYRDRLYNRKRMFFIDGKPYPAASHLDEDWAVKSANRRKVMAPHVWMMEQEQEFLVDPEASIGGLAFSTLAELPDAIGLDFFGVDFSVLPDGRPLVYAVGAAMEPGFDQPRSFPYTRPHLQRIAQAFRTMLATRVAPRPPLR
ncbi:MAG: hypothetical protein AB7G39_00080 [Alphaproteobacteria bacterium]